MICIHITYPTVLFNTCYMLTKCSCPPTLRVRLEDTPNTNPNPHMDNITPTLHAYVYYRKHTL